MSTGDSYEPSYRLVKVTPCPTDGDSCHMLQVHNTDVKTKCLQLIHHSALLFCAHAVDLLIAALGTLGAAETKCTKRTVQTLKKLLNYAATHADATLGYQP